MIDAQNSAGNAVIEDRGRRDPFGSGENGVRGEINHHPEDRGRDAAIDLHEPFECAIRQLGRETQRQRA